MIQFDWFEEDEEDDLSAAQRAFLASLRQRAQSWPCGPEATQIVAPGDGCDQWRAVLDVPSQIDSLILITVGVCFDDANIHASEVHNQSFCPCPAGRSRVEVIEASGTPEQLAHVAADWFEHVLARPVERREWLVDGRTAREYAFSDTGTGLSRQVALFPGAYVGPPHRVTHDRPSL